VNGKIIKKKKQASEKVDKFRGSVKVALDNDFDYSV